MTVWVPLVAVLVLVVSGTAAVDYHAMLVLSVVTAVAAAVSVAVADGSRVRRRSVGPLLVVPALALLAVAPWFPACGWRDGWLFWLLGPPLSLLVGLSAGVLAALLVPARRQRGRRAVRVAVAVGVLLAACGPAAWRFLTAPQVFAYAMPVGWVAGAIYEDGVAVRWPYVAYRLLDVAICAPWLAVWHTLRREGVPWSWPVLLQRARRDRAVAVALAMAVVAGVVSALRAAPEGWSVSTAEVERRLPVQMAVGQLADGSPAAVIHAPAGARYARQRALLAADVGFRAAQLQRWFGGLAHPAQVYAWPSAEAKRAAMGADRVEIAKPWLRQVHVVLPEYGASVLAHELAHVYAAQWAPGPFGVPLRHGWLPDAWTIEGLAVAAEWPIRGGLDPHQWARAARQLGKAPSLQTVLSAQGFYSQNSDLAYTLAGSLLRWLRDTHGLAALRRVYRDGDFEAATGQSLAALEAAWGRAVDDAAQHPLAYADLERARARFEPPGLLQRPCALAVGRCRDRAAVASAAGNDRQARDLWLGLEAALDGGVAGEVDLGVQLAARAAASAAGQPHDAAAQLGVAQQRWSRLAAPARPNLLQQAAVQVMAGDLAWHSGLPAEAVAQWQAAGRLPVSEATHRVLEAKIALAAVPQAHELMRSQLTSGGPVRRLGPVLEALDRDLPGHPLATWLWARWALRVRGDEPALQRLAAALPLLRAAYPWTAREAARTLALYQARRGDCAPLADPLLADEPAPWRQELQQRCAWANSPAQAGGGASLP